MSAAVAGKARPVPPRPSSPTHAQGKKKCASPALPRIPCPTALPAFLARLKNRPALPATPPAQASHAVNRSPQNNSPARCQDVNPVKTVPQLPAVLRACGQAFHPQNRAECRSSRPVRSLARAPVKIKVPLQTVLQKRAPACHKAPRADCRKGLGVTPVKTVAPLLAVLRACVPACHKLPRSRHSALPRPPARGLKCPAALRHLHPLSVQRSAPASSHSSPVYLPQHRRPDPHHLSSHQPPVRSHQPLARSHQPPVLSSPKPGENPAARLQESSASPIPRAEGGGSRAA